MSKVYFVIFLLPAIWNIFVFMVDHEPQHIKPSIVKWLECLEVNEKNIPTFLYSIHSTEQIPYFYYIDKILTLVPIFILIYFIYHKVKNYHTFKCLYHWLFKFVSDTQNIKNPVFISLHDAIAKIIEQLDVKQLCKYYKLNEHTIYLYLTYERFNSFELFVILTLILEEKLTLYAHKVIGVGCNTINTTHLSLQKIPKSLFLTCDIYSAKSWSDNYNTIYNSIHGIYKYTNVSMKLEEVDNFIKKHKSI